MDWLADVPAAAWAAFGVIGGALIAMFGNWLKDRRAAKVDAGQLALEYATSLREDIKKLESRVDRLENEKDAYRSHAHVLHEWGGHVETVERPRPIWPQTLPM